MLKTIFCRYSLYFIGVITVLSSSSCNLSGHKNDDSPCHNGIIYYSDTTMSGIKDPIAKELFQEGCSYSDKSNLVSP